jgi:hypothetical protein
MVDGSVKGLWSVIMGAFYFYIRWVGERVMSAHGVGQNIGIVVWESKYKKLEEKNKELSDENEKLQHDLQEQRKKLIELAKEVEEELDKEMVFDHIKDPYEKIIHGIEMLNRMKFYLEVEVDDLRNFREECNRNLFELIHRTGIAYDGHNAITTGEDEKSIYKNWNFNDVAEILAKIEKRIVIEKHTVFITDEERKQYLQILELPEDTNVDSEEGWKAVKNAYKRLAKKFHPDNKEGDTEKFKEINTAYIHLKELHEQKTPARFVGSITCNSHARPMDLSTALHIFNTFMQSEAIDQRRATGNPYFIKRSM